MDDAQPQAHRAAASWRPCERESHAGHGRGAAGQRIRAPSPGREHELRAMRRSPAPTPQYLDTNGGDGPRRAASWRETDVDLAARRRSVLGADVVDRLFPGRAGRPSLGQRVLVGGRAFTVVGVHGPARASSWAWTLDNARPHALHHASAASSAASARMILAVAAPPEHLEALRGRAHRHPAAGAQRPARQARTTSPSTARSSSSRSTTSSPAPSTAWPSAWGSSRSSWAASAS